MTALVARELWTWTAMKSWTPTPATILYVDVKSRVRKGRTTSKATARYEYQFAGRTYKGSRVAINWGFDKNGSYQRDRAAQLRPLIGVPGGATCYVDPKMPSQATLYRDLRLGIFAFNAVFATAFTGVGAWMLRTAWRNTKTA
jgi:hypothetical protein